MKTVLLIYTQTKLEKVGYAKRYAFKTNEDLKEGDMLKSDIYTTNMQIVKVLEEDYKYFNKETGELSNEYKSTNQFEIRELKLLDKATDIVFATKL